jgi:hypothetical protein
MLKPEKVRRQTRMRNKMMKWIFPLLALLLLAPWPIAFAHDTDMRLVSQDTVQIEVAEVSEQPTLTAFGKAINGVTPGTLFYCDATDNPNDISVTLYLTNARDLIGCYRYLILELGIYIEGNNGEWEKASTCDGEPIPETFITMRDAQVSFTLPGLAEYRVNIDGGSSYCTGTNMDGSGVSPQFYLTVN